MGDIRLHPDDLREIVNAVQTHAVGQADHVHVNSPWLSAQEAALYLRCPLSRIRRLTMTRDLPHEKDGSRVLYHRDELDAYLRAGGAISP